MSLDESCYLVVCCYNVLVFDCFDVIEVVAMFDVIA